GTSIGIWLRAMRAGRSSAVSTAWTPGRSRAADVSMARILAWACGLRTKHACNAPASLMSSTKRPRPVNSAGSSRRATRAPKALAPMVECPGTAQCPYHDIPKALHCNRDRSYVSRETIKVATMLDVGADAHRSARKPDAGPPLDFQSHLAALEALGMLLRIDRAINKDTELHPLVRWQFQGGLREDQRRAFLFTNVIDSSGRRYDIPVAVGALAASPQIYAVGMGRAVEEIEGAWVRAIASPIPPALVEAPACQAVVITGEELRGSGKGLARLPVPISTPGFDAAPYLTAALCVTRDPDPGIQNMGTYRGALKATDRLGVRMAARIGGAGGYLHWKKHNRRGEPMPCAIVVGCAPVAMFTGGMKLAVDFDEMAGAGGLARAPMRTARAGSVHPQLPGRARVPIARLRDPDLLEPEGPFGESHGHVALEDFNMSMRVTAITHRPSPVFASIISQVTPSESSVLKKVAMEPLFLTHLRQ